MAEVIDNEAIKRGQNIMEEYENKIKKSSENFGEKLMGYFKYYSFDDSECTRIQKLFESGKLKKLSEVFTKTEYKDIFDTFVIAEAKPLSFNVTS